VSQPIARTESRLAAVARNAPLDSLEQLRQLKRQRRLRLLRQLMRPEHDRLPPHR